MDITGVERFEEYRPLMLSIAYRMLGTITEAEDIVQEAFLRYQAASPERIVSHKAFLSTVVTRLCLNQLELARIQREAYIGPWLPEPVLTDMDERFTPAHQAEMHESVSMAFLVLLEQLTPAERAVFLLREVFDYEYAEVAAIIGKEEAACRQLLSRAKKHIADHRPRFKPTPEAHRQLLTQFVQAVRDGELAGLLEILADDVELWADGGGKTLGAFTRPLHGRDAVSRFLLASPRFARAGSKVDVIEINGAPSLMIHLDRKALVVLSLSVDQGQVHAIWIIGNPDKLQPLNRVLRPSGEKQR
jgi:RNA polymerase sigma-70 factor (ECF subfamily)